MSDANGGEFALASNLEEVMLRRKLLFRLLRDFDFSHPEIHGEMISDPLPTNAELQRWTQHRQSA